MKTKIVKISFLSFTLFFYLGTTLVLAEDGQNQKIIRPALNLKEVRDLKNDASTSPKTMRTEIKDVRKETVKENMDERKDMRVDIKDIRDDMRSGSTTRPEGLQEMRDRLEEGRKNIKLNRAEATSTIEKLRAELFARELRLVIARLNAGVERFEIISNRMDSRIAKLDQEGANTTDAKAKLAEAKAKIDQAKTDITLITLPTPPSPLTKDQMNAVKNLINTAKKSLKSAQEDLNETVKILKNIPKTTETTTSTSN